jgi:magnesium transporter
MLGKLLQPEVESLVHARDFGQLRELFSDWPPADIADVIADLPEEDQVVIFRVLPQKLAASVFEYLDAEAQQKLLHSMGQEDAVRILNEMSPDDRTTLLEELPPEAVKQLVASLSPAERQVAQSLLGYPEGSVGRLMTPDFVAVKPDWTIRQVLDHVRLRGKDSESLNVLYVLDDQGHLIDDLRIREFLIRPLDAKVSEMMNDVFTSLSVADTQESAVSCFRKYDRTVLPVTDSGGRLVGVVTVDDVLDVAEEAATEDIQKFGGLEAALDLPYMSSSFWDLFRKRGSCLLVLFLGEMLTATAMQSFDEEIKKASVLALFLPLVISSGGNSGSQSSTLVVRAMALGEVSLREWWRVAGREVVSGMSLGLLLGTVGFVRIMLWSALGWDKGLYGHHPSILALSVGLALIGIVLWGSLSGAMLPFILRVFKLDPATSSAPFVATLVDVTGLIIYFMVAAAIFLPHVVH